jgi:two-component system, sensor histidine kinase
MFLIKHLKFLWNGGLDPRSATLIKLRERRTISTTIFLVLPVAVAMIVFNYYTGAVRDNLAIGVAMAVVFSSLYIQAYSSQQLIASQLPLLAFWGAIVNAMLPIGIGDSTWAWLLCLPAIATLTAGRIAGVVWAILCGLSLWGFAYLDVVGYEFASIPNSAAPDPYTQVLEASMVLLMLTAAIFVFRTAQNNAEQRLSSTVNQLEREVHDRTLAETEARASEQAKSSFLAAMSHELRTPLNGVIGASQLLMDGELSSKKRELVNVVVQSSETLMELINNVLDLSRLDSKTIKLESVPLDLREILHAAVAPLSFQAKEKGLGFSLVIEEGVPQYVLGDPARLRQILLNLVGNAVKFTSKGEIKLEVDNALERIRIKVSDTGIGIPKEAQASLFEPYVQANVSIMRKFGGSGLGLSIVKRLVAAMDGKVMVNSVPGEGSTFTVFLPLEPTSRTPGKAADKSVAMVPKLSVVVGDDNAVNSMVMSRMLEADGHDVVTLSNGKEVVHYLSSHKVDLVLLDLQMPVMDGVTALRKIRAMNNTNARVPVIAVTANVTQEKPEELLAQGMDAFLGKPFRQEELREAVRAVVSTKTT